LRRVRLNFRRGKPTIVTCIECVFVALVIQHANRQRLIISSSVACLALPRFPTLSHKWNEFRKKMFLNTKCVLILSPKFVRIQRDSMNVKYFDLHVKYPSFLSHCNEILISRQIFEKYSPKFPVRKDGQTDKTNLIVFFRRFVNAPEIQDSGVHKTSSLAVYCILNFVYSLILYQIPNIHVG